MIDSGALKAASQPREEVISRSTEREFDIDSL